MMKIPEIVKIKMRYIGFLGSFIYFNYFTPLEITGQVINVKEEESLTGFTKN